MKIVIKRPQTNLIKDQSKEIVVNQFSVSATSLESFVDNSFTSHKYSSLWAVWCARQVEHLMEDKRSIYALDAVEKFFEGKITEKELNAAVSSAYAAYAASYAASYTAYYAAYASSASYAASYAATNAAYYAAYAASYAASATNAAYYASRKEMEEKQKEAKLRFFLMSLKEEGFIT